eukprot:15333238-Ditylum_brightwellii.AAC.1
MSGQFAKSHHTLHLMCHDIGDQQVIGDESYWLWFILLPIGIDSQLLAPTNNKGYGFVFFVAQSAEWIDIHFEYLLSDK